MKLTFKIWMLIIAWLAALVMIGFNFQSGVIVKSVEKNSSVALSGLTSGEIIKNIDGKPITSMEEYIAALPAIEVAPIDFIIVTDAGTFSFKSKTLDIGVENLTIIDVYDSANGSGLQENMTVQSINGESVQNDFDFFTIKNTLEPKVTVTLQTNKQTYRILTSEQLGITAGPIPLTKVKTGLDLQGGARALVEPERKLTPQELDDLISVSSYRLNVYGISDVSVRPANDLSGNTYMLVEVAGATPTELRELISQQGKFEARIGNETVFAGGKEDITNVCRNDATCAGIEACYEVQGGSLCRFRFSVYLSEAAARRHATITGGLTINASANGNYLSKTLDLYLDDTLTDSLFISEDLKGEFTTQVQVQGSGTGRDRQEAIKNAQENMQKLQTVLITGSLPFKLEIVKLDSVSPLLGQEFGRIIFLAMSAAFLAVTLVLFARFRKLKVVALVLITMVSELFFVLALAAFIKWNIDLAGIAGIIASIGTGVNDQIVIIDESRMKNTRLTLKERVKRAFIIILGAYSTVVASLIPLWWAGAGLLKGFALTTLLGITVGVFITRPAFADMWNQTEQQ